MKTPEQIAEAEYYKSVRSEEIPELRFALMMHHAKGQCEMVTPSERCPNFHGRRGVTVAGMVILTPTIQKGKPKLFCQKCSFDEVKKLIAFPIIGKKSRKKETQGEVLL